MTTFCFCLLLFTTHQLLFSPSSHHWFCLLCFILFCGQKSPFPTHFCCYSPLLSLLSVCVFISIILTLDCFCYTSISVCVCCVVIESLRETLLAMKCQATNYFLARFDLLSAQTGHSGWCSVVLPRLPPPGPQFESHQGALQGLGFQSLLDGMGFPWNKSLGFPPKSTT